MGSVGGCSLLINPLFVHSHPSALLTQIVIREGERAGQPAGEGSLARGVVCTGAATPFLSENYLGKLKLASPGFLAELVLGPGIGEKGGLNPTPRSWGHLKRPP